MQRIHHDMKRVRQKIIIPASLPPTLSTRRYDILGPLIDIRIRHPDRLDTTSVIGGELKATETCAIEPRGLPWRGNPSHAEKSFPFRFRQGDWLWACRDQAVSSPYTRRPFKAMDCAFIDPVARAWRRRYLGLPFRSG